MHTSIFFLCLSAINLMLTHYTDALGVTQGLVSYPRLEGPRKGPSTLIGMRAVALYKIPDLQHPLYFFPLKFPMPLLG